MKTIRKQAGRKPDPIEALILDTPALREVEQGLKFKLDLTNVPASADRAACLPPSAPVPVEAFDLRELLKLAVGENARADEAEDRNDLYAEACDEIQRRAAAYLLAHQGRKQVEFEKVKELLKDIQSECASVKPPASQ